MQIKALSWKLGRNHNVQRVGNTSETKKEIHIMKKSLQVFLCVKCLKIGPLKLQLGVYIKTICNVAKVIFVERSLS